MCVCVCVCVCMPGKAHFLKEFSFLFCISALREKKQEAPLAVWKKQAAQCSFIHSHFGQKACHSDASLLSKQQMPC